MKKVMTAVIGVVMAALIGFGGVALSAQQGVKKGSIWIGNEAEHAAKAGILIDTAINAALQAVPGTVIGAALENENGYLVYGVEIVKADQQIMDVKVDAGNGKILKVDRDRRDNEGREGEDAGNGHEEGGER